MEKKLGINQKIILVISEGDYYGEILNRLKQLSGKSVCYVTLNKTQKALREDFKKNKIDMSKMIIIDAISKTVKPNQKVEKNCFFVSSPGALTELAISIKKFLDYGFEYLIFDSLNSLLVYREAPVVKRWVSSIMRKIRESNTQGIFYMLNLDDQQDLIKETKSFVDKILNLGKKKGPSAFTGSLFDEEPAEENIKVKTRKKNKK
jgi:KaiC/GvpD/RAD55 family RecA-like ATPase